MNHENRNRKMTMNHDALKWISALALAGVASACTTQAPPALTEARSAYEASNRGMTAKMAPTELYEARGSLDTANREFADNGDTAEVLDYAYIAHRKIQRADVAARTEVDRRKMASYGTLGIAVRDEQLKDGQTKLATTRRELDDERDLSAAQKRDLNKTESQLEAEKLGRASAEGKLAAAMRDLARVAAVNNEARGVVITLSGSILFASGQSALLETAKEKLDQVAEALKAQDDDKTMVVEGHTDSVGGDAMNERLSLARANAVREYLIARGVDAKKISAVGRGSTQPLVDNKTVENRSNNRRVEIVIKPSKKG